MTEDESTPRFRFPDPATDFHVTPERLRRAQELIDKATEGLVHPYPSREATNIVDASFLEAVELMSDPEWMCRYWIRPDEDGDDRAR